MNRIKRYLIGRRERKFYESLPEAKTFKEALNDLIDYGYCKIKIGSRKKHNLTLK